MAEPFLPLAVGERTRLEYQAQGGCTGASFGLCNCWKACFIDHNKLFSLIKVASWSLDFPKPYGELVAEEVICLYFLTVNRPGRWASRPGIVGLAACHRSVNFDLHGYVIVLFPLFWNFLPVRLGNCKPWVLFRTHPRE